MRDRFGRQVDYLRLSVTDLCPYRCRYCVPEEGVRCGEALTVEECIEIVRACRACGVRKVRLTGGEPLARRDILDICRGISSIPGVDELCLTTNGSKLAELAAPLRQAGVARLNISLDTLRADRFRAVTRTGELEEALAGLRAALAAGFEDLKINAVLIGGFNDDEIGDFIDLTVEHPWEVRFIELMPMGPCAAWPADRFLPCGQVLRRFPRLVRVEDRGVARRYRLPGARGTVGLIAPMSCAFCDRCSRLRVTADGQLKGCLHSREEIPLRGLRGAALERAVRAGIAQKPREHHLTARPSDTPRTMNQIGG